MSLAIGPFVRSYRLESHTSRLPMLLNELLLVSRPISSPLRIVGSAAGFANDDTATPISTVASKNGQVKSRALVQAVAVGLS